MHTKAAFWEADQYIGELKTYLIFNKAVEYIPPHSLTSPNHSSQSGSKQRVTSSIKQDGAIHPTHLTPKKNYNHPAPSTSSWTHSSSLRSRHGPQLSCRPESLLETQCVGPSEHHVMKSLIISFPPTLLKKKLPAAFKWSLFCCPASGNLSSCHHCRSKPAW